MRLVALAVFPLAVLAVHGILRLTLGDLYRRWMRLALLGVALHGSVALGVFAFLDRRSRLALPEWFKWTFPAPGAAVLVSLLALVFLAPLWGPVSAALRRLSGPRPRKAVSVPPAPPAARPREVPIAPTVFTRRRFLETAAMLPPAALAATGPLGAVSAAEGPFVRRIELAWPDLPPGLDGTTLAQVSDVHIGFFVEPDDLARALEPLRQEPPDLFLVTGDLIDDVDQLGATMAALGTVRPRLGAFACPGNHEHYAGFPAIRRAFERSPIQLLVDQATTVRAAGAALEVSGADYPTGTRGERMTVPERFPWHAEEALVRRAAGGDFRLHLVHHPHAWDAVRTSRYPGIPTVARWAGVPARRSSRCTATSAGSTSATAGGCSCTRAWATGSRCGSTARRRSR
jgi:hypothetical protein